MQEQLSESQWTNRFVDEVLELLPVLGRERIAAVAKSCYAQAADRSPTAAALVYATAVMERLLGRVN